MVPGTCQSGDVPLKTPEEIEQMRPVGRLVADVLSSLQEFARIGMTTNDLDAHAAEMIAAAGARSVYLGYHPSFGAMPYPGVSAVPVTESFQPSRSVPGRPMGNQPT